MKRVPKKFDLISPDFKRNPIPTCAAMRAVGPVVPVRFPIIGQVSFVTTHASVEKLLKSPENFSVDFMRSGRSALATIVRWMPGPLRQLSENMLQKDDPEHRRLRKLVDGTFRRNEIDALRPRIEVIAEQLLDKLEASDDGDLLRHVARDLPLAVICELLGLPQSDRPKFTRWMASLSQANSAMGFARLFPAINRISRYLREKFEERRADPQDDLISALIHAEDDGDHLNDDELLAMCFILFVAGHETTTHLISGGVLALLQHPGQLEQLRGDPGRALSATDELLRFVSPVQMTKPRMPVADMEFEGVPVRKGQILMALLASANMDPDAFQNPETLDITREKNHHVALGAGPHFCLGAWLARTEMEIFLQRLLDRAPGLELRVSEAELRWVKGTGMRALKTLPVKLR